MQSVYCCRTGEGRVGQKDEHFGLEVHVAPVCRQRNRLPVDNIFHFRIFSFSPQVYVLDTIRYGNSCRQCSQVHCSPGQDTYKQCNILYTCEIHHNTSYCCICVQMVLLYLSCTAAYLLHCLWSGVGSVVRIVAYYLPALPVYSFTRKKLVVGALC